MDVSILSNTPTQQVIYDDADDIWMGNFYEIGKVMFEELVLRIIAQFD
ncbi:polysaccharide lyase beta-sandwich domain-containing protein [Bacillus sp. B-TM1]